MDPRELVMGWCAVGCGVIVVLTAVLRWLGV